MGLAMAVLLVSTPDVAVAQTHDSLTVGTYQYGALDRRGAIAPFAHALGLHLGRPVRIMVAPDPVALAESVRVGKVDVAITNTFGYLLLADTETRAAEAVATFRIPVGVRTNYSTTIVTLDNRAGSWRTLVDHATRLRIGLVSPGSTTGNLVPRLALATVGLSVLETSVQGVTYGGTHAAAFHLLRAGTVDLAGLATEEYQRQLMSLPPSERTRFRVLWASPDITLGPIAVRRALPSALRDSIRNAAVGLEARHPRAFAALRDGWTEARRSDGLIAASDTTYAAVRRLFGDGTSLVTLVRQLSR